MRRDVPGTSGASGRVPGILHEMYPSLSATPVAARTRHAQGSTRLSGSRPPVAAESTDRVQTILPPHVTIFGVPVHCLTRPRIIALCRQWIGAPDGQRHIVTANAEILLRARSDPWFSTVIREAGLVTADGAGVRWAAAFLYGPIRYAPTPLGILRWFTRTLAVVFLKPQSVPDLIPERISGADLVTDIAREAAAVGARVYLIGGRRQTAVRAARRLHTLFPRLAVSGFAPDHIATPYPPYDLHIAIERTAPAVVFVGYGAPQQEEWIHQNLHRFPSIRVAVGVGGALDFLVGNAPRAPSRYQAHSLEWFWRVTHNPARVLRTLRATLIFSMILLASRLFPPRTTTLS